MNRETRPAAGVRPTPGNVRSENMSKFKVNWPEQTGQDLSSRLNTDPGSLVKIEFWRNEADKDAPIVFSACLREMVTNTDNDALTAFYASAVCCFMPGVRLTFEEALKDRGAEPDYLMMPRQGPSVGAQFPLVESRTKCLIAWAQLIMILYKNITPVNYTRYMTARINALKAHVGFLGDDSQLIALDINKATIIKTAFGSVYSLRKEVLDTLLRGRHLTGLLGAVCSYLCGILSWTDMGGIKMIFEAFCITNSPVLRDERVVNEVRALADAFVLINKHNLPQYFRIQAPPLHQKFLKRANYSTLLSVAQKIREEVHPSLKNFVVPSTTTDATRDDLYRIHKHAEERYVTSAQESSIRFLTNFGTGTD